MSSRCSHNMVNFGPVMAEIGSGVWVSPVNFNGSRVLAALLHGSTRSQHPANFAVLNSWIEGATYVRQGDHHVGHWPDIFSFFSSPNLNRRRLDVCRTSTHGMALVRISDAGLKPSARGSLKTQDAKKSPKIAIWAPPHNFVGLYLRN